MPAIGAETIDVLLTYVDGSAPGFTEAYTASLGHPPSPCHVRTLGELRYVLRSIHQHVPWVGNVVLVVKDQGHVPRWLNRDTVRVVTHGEFLPASCSPCFSVFAIQAWSHRIEGIAPRYLLWSDDQLALQPLHVEDFFDDGLVPHARRLACERFFMFGADRDRFTRRLANSYLALDAVTPAGTPGRGARIRTLASHVPTPVSTTLWAEFLEDFQGHAGFLETIHSPSRDGTEDPSIRTTVKELWCSWLLARSSEPPDPAGLIFWSLGKLAERLGLRRAFVGAYSVHHDPRRTRTSLARMLRLRPHVACVNDEAYDRYTDERGNVWHQQMELEPNSQRALLQALESCFPDPSPYEVG